MSVTADQLITETIGYLQSWSLDSEQMTTLAADLQITDLAGTVTATRGVATGISPGILEIDQELLYCDTTTQVGAFTITPWGRGYLNTVAAFHPAGSKVISQPTFPRAKVLDSLNEVMQRVFPDIFAVKIFEDTTKAVQVTYDLPDDAQWVLDARWQTPGGRLYWQGIRRWRISSGGGTQFGDTGITVDVADRMAPGRPIEFRYAAKPQSLVNTTDDFETTTGLPSSLRDVVCLGAAAALTTSQELSRLEVSSVEQQNRSQLVAPSAALTSSGFLEKRFQTRLAEERATLQRLFPPRVTGSWR